jgi:Holliday junction resolvase RusA-like endonuclease
LIVFEIPGEAIGKARPRFVRSTGRAFTPAKTEAFEAVIKTFAQRAMEGHEPFAGPVRMEVRAVYLHPASWSAKRKANADWKTSKPDFDNIGKIVADAINKIVFADDAQVADCTIQKKYGPVAKLVVVVTELEQ